MGNKAMRVPFKVVPTQSLDLRITIARLSWNTAEDRQNTGRSLFLIHI